MADNTFPQDLGKALAPDDAIFEVTENDSTPDPLAGGTVTLGDDLSDIVVEGPIPDAELSTLPERAIELSNSTDDVEVSELDENPSIETVPGVAPVDTPAADKLSIPEDVVEIEEMPELEVEDPQNSLNYSEPGTLVASVLAKARTFAEYDINSPNSIVRASALCDSIEKMILAGVTQDAEHQKLSIAQLRLLDDIEEGVHYTRAFLSRHDGKREIKAGHIGDFALQNGAYDPFCATVARVLINAQVQGGKKIQDVFAKLKTQYGINKREEFQIGQVMLDMGYPVSGSLVDGFDMIEQHYS
jgi:hypothetical protein